MKVKIYFVTYKEDSVFKDTLDSFYDNGGSKCFEINVINNFSSILLNYPKINVYNNVLRPDFSTGHLSRNWNQAIINGFKDLENPDCDILIHAQNDVTFMPDWYDKLINIHNDKKIDFFATGAGDCFCSYTPQAIKNIGIWDERFCGIGYQEADYFTRAAYHSYDTVSINDFGHKRVLNPIAVPKNDIEGFDAYKEIGICYKSTHGQGQNEHHTKSGQVAHEPSHTVFGNKYTYEIGLSNLEIAKEFAINKRSIYTGTLKTSMLYPYFENKIPNRKQKDYIN